MYFIIVNKLQPCIKNLLLFLFYFISFVGFRMNKYILSRETKNTLTKEGYLNGVDKHSHGRRIHMA